MIAPIRFPLVPAEMFNPIELPPDREYSAREPSHGEQCFAIMLYVPPKRSKWRPRVVDAIPPMHKGKRIIWWPHFKLAPVLVEVRDFNERMLKRCKPGKAPENWSVAVELVCGFDETARVVDLTKGGA